VQEREPSEQSFRENSPSRDRDGTAISDAQSSQDSYFAPVDYDAVNPTTATAPAQASHCGLTETDVEFIGATFFVLANMTRPEECCAKCQMHPKCRSWVLDSGRQECKLKHLKPGSMPAKISQRGATSGLPFRWDRNHSVLCFAVMRPASYEQGLLAWQYQRKVNLFACDEWSVFSSKRVEIVPGLLESAVVDSDLKCDVGGEFGTALNTEIFFKVWDMVFEEGRYLYHTWVVKVDPDAVLFVDRLRVALSYHREEENGVYLNNCKFGLHGPLEVFSQNATTVWRHGRKKCVDHFTRLCSGPCLWGEGMFIDQCLQKVHKVRRANDWNLISEDHCDSPDWSECRNGRITFHPFKDKDSYEKCLQNAQAKPWSPYGALDVI